MSSRLGKAWDEEIKQRIEDSRRAIKVKETVEAVQDTVFELRKKIKTNEFVSKEEVGAAKALFDGAKLLLAKSMPDLKEVEHKGDVGASLAELVLASMKDKQQQEAPQPTQTH